MKYAYTKQSGEILGWYDKDIHDVIPEPNIEVSDEEWCEAINKNANAYDEKSKNFIVLNPFNIWDKNKKQWIIDEQKKQKAEIKSLVENVTTKIENIVQEEINKYNEANQMEFNNIDSIVKYLNFTEYKHHSFVVQILEFNLNIWEKARKLQDKILKGEMQFVNIEDILNQLPVFEFKES